MERIKKYFSCVLALILATVCYALARRPELSPAAAASLAARFRFQKLPLPEIPDPPRHKFIRQVHPSLERIAAWVSSLGAAVTLADLDGDGLPNDACYVDPRTDLVTVGPVPGTGARYVPFALHPDPLPYDAATMAPMGSLAGDFNEDGRMDVLVYYWGRTPVLFLRRNSGPSGAGGAVSRADFVATELTESGERWYSNAALQADLDGDGHLDLLIGNYFQDGAHVLDARAGGTEVMHAGKSKALNGGYKHVFLAAANGGAAGVHYREVQGVFSEDVARGWTLAMGAADLDGDLLPELYLANDFGPDRLLHNRSTPGHLNFALLEGRREFTTPKSCVLGHDSFKGMGVEFGDINGDGLLDIYVSNIATKFALTESHFLWLNTGETGVMQQGIAPFVHASEKLGLARSGFSWDARLADFDNDGVPEALQGCGFIKGKINRWPELQALGTSNDQMIHNPRFWPNFKQGSDLSGHDCNPFFVLGPDGRYHDIGSLLGMGEPMVTRGIAIADVNGDGRLDFVTANQWGPSYFFRNESPGPATFLGLRLIHPNGSPAIGAVARVNLPNGRKGVAQADGGSGHSGRRSPDIHFGLGAADKSRPVSVEIRWRDRSGTIQQKTESLLPGWHTIALGSERTIAGVTPAPRAR